MNSTTAESCCICLSEYAPHENPFELPCGHRVHSGCMLRLCLSHGNNPRCPYCRALVRGNEDELETEDESDMSSEASQELPQWRRLTWFAPASSRSTWIRRQVMKRHFQRARNKRAPAVLKRCAEEHRRLSGDLLAARQDEAAYRSGRPQKTVKETLARLSQKTTAVRKAEARIEAHSRRAWQRCTGSSAVCGYLSMHPLAEVA